MALPKEYFDLLNTTTASNSSSFAGLTPSNREDIVRQQYPGMFFETEEPRDYGTFSDLMKSTGKGFVSGLTWSAVDLKEKDWENMNTMERTGWIIGEGGSLFTPVLGPFHMLGKGGQLATRALGNKFIKEIAKQSGRITAEQSANVLRGVHNLSKKTNIPYEKIVRGLDKDIQIGLRKTTKGDGVNWINQLSIGGDEADIAQSVLKKHGVDNILKAFEKNNIKNVNPQDVNTIADAFVDGIANKKYVNDIAEWLERGLETRLPAKVSKYLGMAAQDMALMGIHGLGVGAVSQHLRGEEFDASESLSHSAIMSLAFPLIRAIPGGGDATIGQGLKAYWNSYKNVNYPVLAAKYGDDTVRSMLSIMSGGSIKNLRNSSALQRNWKGPGRKAEYTYDDIQNLLFHSNKAKQMPMSDVFSVLEQMKGAVGQEIRANWGNRYLIDLAKSVPRMGIGVIAMNATVFKSGAFRHMDGEELGSHILMSALMTKGKGAWGRDTQRAFLADLQPFYEGLRVLGTDPTVLQDKIRIYSSREMDTFRGASFATDPLGAKIEETFDNALKDYKPDRNAGAYKNNRHRIVNQASGIYNAIKKMKDPEAFKRLNVAGLDEITLDGLKDSIEKIPLQDGKTIKDVGWDTVRLKLTTGPAEKIVDSFGAMFQSIGEAHGIPVSYDPQAKGKKITGELIQGAQNEGSITYNTILQTLERTGKAEITQRGDSVFTERSLKGGTPEKISESMSKFIERTYDSLDAEYGGKKLYANPRKNSYLEFVSRASAIESKDYLYKVISGDPDLDASHLASSMDKLFSVHDASDNSHTKYRSQIGDYTFEKGKDENQSKQRTQDLLDLENLFSAMHISRNIASDPSASSKVISLADLNATANTFRERFDRFPENFKKDFYSRALTEFATRAMDSSPLDVRAIHTLRMGISEGLVFYDKSTKRIQLMSSDSVDASFQNASARDRAQAKENLDAIARALGPEIQRPQIQLVETDSSQFQNITLETIAKVAKATRNENIRSLLQEGIAVTQGIKFESNPVQKKLKDIAVSLENGINIKTGDVSLEYVNQIVKDLEHLSNFKMPEKDLSLLETYIGDLKRLSEAGERDQAYTLELGATNDSVRQVLQNLMEAEVSAKNEPEEIVSKLINLAIKGKKGGGLAQTQVMELTEGFNRELHKLMKNSSDRETNLVETIRTYNEEGGSWRDVAEIVRSVNQKLVGKVLSNSHDPLLRDKALDLWEKSYENRQIHHDQRTLQTIVQDYGLHEPGDKMQISKTFVEKAVDTTNPNSVKDSMDEVKKIIYDRAENTASADKEWTRFIEKDSNILISSIMNGSIRQTAQLRSGLLTVNPKGKFRSNPNDDFFDRKSLAGDHKYDVHYLDNNISIAEGKERIFQIDNYFDGDPVRIQSMINRSQRVSELQPEVIREIMKHGKFTDEHRIDLTNLPVSPQVYMRLSPGTRILFSVTKDNLKNLNNDFNNWYDKKINHINDHFTSPDKVIKRFEKLFGSIREGVNTDDGLRLKMLAMHLDHTKTGGFNQWLAEIGKDNINWNALAKIESNLYKRGFLSDGGTTQRFHPKLLDWNAQYHTDPIVRAFSKELRDNLDFKYTIGVLADESFQKLTYNRNGSPFDNRRVVSEKLRADKANPYVVTGDVIDKLIDRQVLDVEADAYKSLNSSLLDGAKIVDERLGRLLWAQKGGMGEWNGAKTVLFSTGDNSLLGKGFAVFIPEVSREMLKMNRGKGVHMLIGDSSAKIYNGISLSKNKAPITPYDFTHTENLGAIGNQGWIRKMGNNMGRNNLMQLDISDIGVQFTSKNTQGVHMSSSMVDWQSSNHIKRTIDWMGIDGLIAERKAIKTMIGYGNDLIHAVFNAKEQKGQVYTESSTGVVREMIDMGMSGTHPLVKGQLDKFLRNEDYKMLSKIPNFWGNDNFIIADIKGDLSLPVFADLLAKRNAKSTNYDLDRRLAAQFGGIGISSNTASIKYGDKNITDKLFVFRDPKNGLDYVVEHSLSAGDKDAKLHFFNPLAEKYDPSIHRLGESKDDLTAHIETVGTKFEKKLTLDKGFKEDVRMIMNEVSELISNHNLDFGQVFKLLKGNQVLADNGAGGVQFIRLSNSQAKIGINRFNQLKGTIGASINAIPKVGKDQPTMRVDAIDGKVANGTIRANAYDLRVTLQRDLDGDHLYTYFDMPFDLIKNYTTDMGHKADYDMMEKHISPSDINIFGLNPSSMNSGLRLGEASDQIGFSKYASHVGRAKMIIGSVISSRKAMSWLEQTKFQYRDDVGQYQNFLKDFSAKASLYSEDMKVLNRLLDTSQNVLDLFQGTNPAVFMDNIENYFFFGKLPKGYEEVMNKESVEALHSRASIFNNPEFGRGDRNAVLHRSMFKIIFRTLSKANKIANDTQDEAGSRAPEVYELQKDHRDLSRFFADPDRFLITELNNEISWKRKSSDQAQKAEARFLREQMIAEFFISPDAYKTGDIQSTNAIETIRTKLNEGKMPARTSGSKFKFGVEKATDTKQQLKPYFDLSVGGKILDKLITEKVYHSTENNADLAVEKHIKAGFIVNNLLDRVAMAKAFDIDPTSIYKNYELNGVTAETPETSKPGRIKNQITAGHIRNILQKEYRDTNNSLRFFNEERFVNPLKLQSLSERVSSIRDAIRIIDKRVADDMVIGRKRAAPNYTKKTKFVKTNFKQDVFVYEIKGKIRAEKNQMGRLSDWKSGDKSLDYGNLKPHRLVRKGDKGYKAYKGHTYIIDKNPLMRESASTIEAQYSDAWKHVTGVGRIDSTVLTRDPVQAEQLRYDTANLRRYISSSYSDAVGMVKKNRVFGNDVHKHASELELIKINEYVQNWMKDGKITGDTQQEQLSLLLKYLMQPQIMTGKYISDGNTELPFYKTGKRLQMQVFNWALDKGYKSTIRDMIIKTEKRFRGEKYSEDLNLEGYKRMYKDGMNWDTFGEDAGWLKSLTKSGMFTSPWNIELESSHNLRPAEYSEMKTVRTPNGNKIVIKEKVPQIYDEKGCLY